MTRIAYFIAAGALVAQSAAIAVELRANDARREARAEADAALAGLDRIAARLDRAEALIP